MSKDLLKKLKAGVAGAGEAEPVKSVENTEAETPAAAIEPLKSDPMKALPVKKQAATKSRAARLQSGLNGFEELYEVLQEEKQDFTFNKRLVYIDDDLADILDLIKKEAKINSNLLTSHLLKKFFVENIGLIKVLKEKRKGNKFLD